MGKLLGFFVFVFVFVFIYLMYRTQPTYLYDRFTSENRMSVSRNYYRSQQTVATNTYCVNASKQEVSTSEKGNVMKSDCRANVHTLAVLHIFWKNMIKEVTSQTFIFAHMLLNCIVTCHWSNNHRFWQAGVQRLCSGKWKITHHQEREK